MAKKKSSKKSSKGTKRPSSSSSSSSSKKQKTTDSKDKEKKESGGLFGNFDDIAKETAGNVGTDSFPMESDSESDDSDSENPRSCYEKCNQKIDDDYNECKEKLEEFLNDNIGCKKMLSKCRVVKPKRCTQKAKKKTYKRKYKPRTYSKSCSTRRTPYTMPISKPGCACGM